MAAATQKSKQCSFSEVILEKENIHTCVECFEEKDLKTLPCEHLQCGPCIDRSYSRAAARGKNFLCAACSHIIQKIEDSSYDEYIADFSSRFPIAQFAMEDNQAEFKRRAKALRGRRLPTQGETYTTVALDCQKDVTQLFEKHARRIAKIEDVDERAAAQKHMNGIKVKIEFGFVKIFQWIRAGAPWIGDRLESFITWIQRSFT